jgi:hypothetical protein
VFELAIYGGTFAPVHNGHIHAARAFFNAVKPDRLLIIPTLIPPHKQLDFADDPQDRLNMLRLAFENEPEYGKKLFISDYELSAPPPSYTVNTLRHFAKEGQRIIPIYKPLGFGVFCSVYFGNHICKLASGHICDSNECSMLNFIAKPKLPGIVGTADDQGIVIRTAIESAG